MTKSLAEENSRRGIYSEFDFLTRVYRHLHFEIITAKCPIRHAACVSAKLRKFQRARAVTDRWRRGNQPEFNIGSINPLAADSDGSNIDAATKEYHTLKIATFQPNGKKNCGRKYCRGYSDISIKLTFARAGRTARTNDASRGRPHSWRALSSLREMLKSFAQPISGKLHRAIAKHAQFCPVKT